MGLESCPFVKECDKSWTDVGGCQPKDDGESYKTCPIYEFGCLVNNKAIQECILELKMDGGEAERLRHALNKEEIE